MKTGFQEILKKYWIPACAGMTKIDGLTWLFKGLKGVEMGDILLQLNNISVVYSDVIQVLKGVFFKRGEGAYCVGFWAVTVLVKTTTLKAISDCSNRKTAK